jgi:hypothetical protein
MLSRLIAARQRDPAVFWLVLSGLVVTQLVAFYLLCSHQVRKAENRRAAVEVQQMAHNDCLQYLAQSTIGSCSAPGAPQAGDATVPVTLVAR